MSTIMNNRLKQFLAAENITQAQFADTINVVRASVSHILSGRNKPSFDFISAMMSKYPNLNMEWIMFGKGKMYKDSPLPEPEQLFPEEIPIPVPAETIDRLPETEDSPLRSAEIQPVIEEKESKLPLTGLNTLGNNLQNIVKQRKVTKVIIMFDDGSYQEM